MQRTGFVVVRFKRSVGGGLNGSPKIIHVHVFIELKKQPNGKKPSNLFNMYTSFIKLIAHIHISSYSRASPRSPSLLANRKYTVSLTNN